MEMNITIAEVTKGTKESLECSQMGRCNREIGMCACKEGFTSSSGDIENMASRSVGEFGTYGERGDCGFRHTATEAYDVAEYAFVLSEGG